MPSELSGIYENAIENKNEKKKRKVNKVINMRKMLSEFMCTKNNI